MTAAVAAKEINDGKFSEYSLISSCIIYLFIYLFIYFEKRTFLKNFCKMFGKMHGMELFLYELGKD